MESNSHCQPRVPRGKACPAERGLGRRQEPRSLFKKKIVTRSTSPNRQIRAVRCKFSLWTTPSQLVISMGTAESPDDTEGAGRASRHFPSGRFQEVSLVNRSRTDWGISLSRQRISFKKNGDILAGSHSWAWAWARMGAQCGTSWPSSCLAELQSASSVQLPLGLCTKNNRYPEPFKISKTCERGSQELASGAPPSFFISIVHFYFNFLRLLPAKYGCNVHKARQP